MSAHIPGPWKAQRSLTKIAVTADEGHVRIANVPSPLGRAQADDGAEANARLIAAAPELLALLHEGRDLMPLDGTHKRADWIRRVLALEAKAEGQPSHA